jgi:hypothetical protein
MIDPPMSRRRRVVDWRRWLAACKCCKEILADYPTTDVRPRMTMQRLCHLHTRPALLSALCLLAFAAPLHGDAAESPTGDEPPPPLNNYPTHARVEYVNECIARHGDKLSSLYQCSCALDLIATRLTYDDFVEASTYSRYAGLPGEGGAIFRDSDTAKKMAKLYKELEADAFRTCGLGTP